MEAKLKRQRQKALNDILIAECKSKNAAIDKVEALIFNGAQINCNNSRPVFVAAKNQNFRLLRFLIKKGALVDPIARNHIAGMCDYKGFSEAFEEDYFDILDEVRAKVGDDSLDLFVPYVNLMAVSGKTAKIKALSARFDVPESELVELIYLRIIFEMITCGYDNALAFVETHKKWISEAAFNLSVSSNEWVVLEYIIEHSDLRTPSEKAVAEALFKGGVQVLIILQKIGYNFLNKPLFLEKACRGAFSFGTDSLEFLLNAGYTLQDRYFGRSILENAILDKNQPLIDFLKKHGIFSAKAV